VIWVTGLSVFPDKYRMPSINQYRLQYIETEQQFIDSAVNVLFEIGVE
jgi:hypothetical protein